MDFDTTRLDNVLKNDFKNGEKCVLFWYSCPVHWIYRKKVIRFYLYIRIKSRILLSTSVYSYVHCKSAQSLFNITRLFQSDFEEEVKRMNIFKNFLLVMVLAVMSGILVRAQETIHWDVVQKIKAEGIGNSKVMEIASYMTDVYGPRLANSPSYDESAEWAKKTFESYGLSNVAIESYGDFGVSWRMDFVSVHMLSPQYMPIIAYPNTWSEGTGGEIRGNAVYIDFDDIASESDLAQYRGKLGNAIVLIEPIQQLSPAWDPLAVRYTNEQLDDQAQVNITSLMERDSRPGRRNSGI